MFKPGDILVNRHYRGRFVVLEKTPRYPYDFVVAPVDAPMKDFPVCFENSWKKV